MMADSARAVFSNNALPIHAFVGHLRQRGVELSADAGVLRLSAPKGVVDAGLAREIARCKPAILACLQAEEDAHSASNAAKAEQPRALVPVASRDGALPLGFVQQRMWLHNQIEPDTVLYNLPAAWRLTGALDAAAFLQAFDDVVDRHEVLQVSIAVEGGQPAQRFDRTGERRTGHAIDVEDLSGVPADEREDALAQRLQALRDQPIDLASGQPFRARLLRMAEEEHVFFLLPHHVVWDGWSFDIFLRDFDETYSAAIEDRPASLPSLPIQYVDYAIWHRDWLHKGELDQQLYYWSEALADAPPPLDLPLDSARPRRFSYRGDWEEFEISATTVERIRRLAANHRGTSFMVLLAAWGAFMHRICGQRDIVVGVPIQARHDPQVTDLIGCFVNTLCLRLRIDPEWSFAQLVDAVRGASLGAYEHQDAPVDLLVERFAAARDASRTPLFQTMFSHQQVSRRPARLGPLALSQVHVNPAATPTDVMLAVMEGASGARGVLHYASDLFAASTIRRMRLRFEHFLEAALDDPNVALHSLPMLTLAERETVLTEWNATAQQVATDAITGGLLDSTQWQVSTAPALRFGSDTISYAELDASVNRLARQLRARGAGRGALVGLSVERSPAMVVALLAIIRSGAAWVPLDPAFPAERLVFMARDAKLALLVSEADTASVLQWPRAQSVLLDADRDEIDNHSGAALVPDPGLDAGPGDPAYVIYTSGSTGRPKGVIVPHRALANFLGSMAVEPGLEAGDRLLAVTTLSFDISILELLLPLSRGAELIMASREQAMDAVALQVLLESSQATIMQATPVTWRLLVEAGWEGDAHLKALVGGETLPVPLARQLLDRTGELWNMYGPTETTIWSTCWRVQSVGDGQAIPIGRPIANTRVYILDDRQQLCPAGVPGEICIGGDGVALGYLHRPQLTAERFIADPLLPASQSSDPPTRLYRTGDRGRWLADGTLEHLGRLDFQVKVRGHRIEPGEIEACLVSQTGASAAVVVVREDRPGDVRLVAYLVPGTGQRPDEHAVRVALKPVLPGYMIPQHVVVLDALPLTPNGKVDRLALPPPQAGQGGVNHGEEQRIKPRDELERAVADVMKQVLSVPAIGIDDDFFDLGGHSLLAVQLFHQINRMTGANLPLAVLLNGSSVRTLARACRVAGTGLSDANADPDDDTGTGTDRETPAPPATTDTWTPLVRIREGNDRAPLFLIHAVGGNVLNYRRLAVDMAPGPAVFGLQALGLDGLTAPLTRVEDMAALYVREIRTVQASGPYHLAGGSMGGIIAYEMAQQLTAAGEQVALLALLDTPAQLDDEALAQRLRRALTQLRYRSRSGSVALDPVQLTGRVTTAASTRVGWLLRKWKVARARRRNVRLPHSVRYAEVEAAHRQAYRGYTVRAYPGAIVLFRASEQESDRGPTLGWDRWVEHVRIIPLSGSHGDLVETPELPGLLDSVLLHSSGTASAMPENTLATAP